MYLILLWPTCLSGSHLHYCTRTHFCVWATLLFDQANGKHNYSPFDRESSSESHLHHTNNENTDNKVVVMEHRFTDPLPVLYKRMDRNDVKNQLICPVCVEHHSSDWFFFSPTSTEIMKYVMSHKCSRYGRCRLFLHFPGVGKCFPGLQEPPTPLITQPVVTLSSAAMHYLKDLLITHRITGSLTVSQTNESRDSIDIQQLHQPPTGHFPPHQCTSQYHSLLKGLWGERKWCSSFEPPAVSDSCLHLFTSLQNNNNRSSRNKTNMSLMRRECIKTSPWLHRHHSEGDAGGDDTAEWVRIWLLQSCVSQEWTRWGAVYKPTADPTAAFWYLGRDTRDSTFILSGYTDIVSLDMC